LGARLVARLIVLLALQGVPLDAGQTVSPAALAGQATQADEAARKTRRVMK